MTVKIADASTIAAIIFGEPAAETAATLIRGCHLASPHLLPLEIANVALKKMKREGLSSSDAKKAISKYTDFGIDLIEIDARETFALALEFNLTAYDASYLWLSRRLGCELVTLDERLQLAAAQGSKDAR